MTTISIPYSYSDVLNASLKGGWRVEDLIGDDKPLDFERPFLPETFARTRPLAFLDERESRVLNQIRGFGYLCTFGLVEEFILPFVLDHTRPQVHGDDARTRALLQFAAEEAKHIDLFKRFRSAFEVGFGSSCAFIGPGEEIAAAVLAHDPLAVALVILHIEWMTQRHYLDSIRDDQRMDPQFQSLLKHHWIEEAQHAKLDTNVVLTLASERSPEQCMAAVEQYLKIGALLDGGLKQQVLFDLESLERATGRKFTSAEREQFCAVQHQAQRWTFLGSGMTHARFLQTLGEISPEGRRSVESVAPVFC